MYICARITRTIREEQVVKKAITRTLITVSQGNNKVPEDHVLLTISLYVLANSIRIDEAGEIR